MRMELKRRRKGRPTRRRKDNVNVDIKETGLSSEEKQTGLRGGNWS